MMDSIIIFFVTGSFWFGIDSHCFCSLSICLIQYDFSPSMSSMGSDGAKGSIVFYIVLYIVL